LTPQARTPPRPFELGHADIDPRLVAVWKRLASRVLAGRSRLSWQYGDPQGEPVLRQAIAEYLAAARGVRCRPEQIVVTSGTQQGLSLAARVLLDPGDQAWVEDPCYRAALDILRAAEARIVPVAVDAQGLDIGAAPQQGAPNEPGARLVYTTPSRQYPLGMAMPLARRMALLAWAEAAGAWIIEDDYESEFQKPAQMLPSLQGLDRAGRVIYLGTFSKLLFPALRLGYAVLPEDLVAPFTAARHLADRQSSSLLQALMPSSCRRILRAASQVDAASLCGAAGFLIARGGTAGSSRSAAGLRHVPDGRAAGGRGCGGGEAFGGGRSARCRYRR
jgi:GntR family transcriptional regulator/MocR family aminotransferase